ncbi:MAG: type II toxin-antitoxin system HicA family toxin [Methylococcaceae bacterium]|nr:MAG: type II toxin-antitoxin system HicA family toxin [Methylococcaceae bacterium]
MVSLFLKFTDYPCRDVKRALSALGFRFIAQKGSHEQWEKIENGIKRKVTVDCHGGVVKAKDVRSIIAQAGVSKSDFLKVIGKN